MVPYGTMYFEIVIYMMPKKAVPIIAISNVSLICGNASSNTDCTSKCTINAIQSLGNRVRIRYQTSDASVISSIKSYGIQVSNMTVIADCRNRT
jgi:hypothetical protein